MILKWAVQDSAVHSENEFMGKPTKRNPLFGSCLAMYTKRARNTKSKSEIWRELSDQLDGEFFENVPLETMKIVIRHRNWTITFETFRELMGENYQTYTRIRAPFVNKNGFRFTIYRKGFFSKFGKLFGMQDVDVGDAAFDKAFVIKGNDESALRLLFANEAIRRLIEQQPKCHLTVWHEEGRWFQSRLPEGVDELCFRVPSVVTNLEQLNSLHELFVEVLNRLCQIGCAYDHAPGIGL